MRRFPLVFPALASWLVSVSLVAAQSLDVAPAYHPEGPAAGYAEVFAGDPLTLEISLPGLDHAQSQAVAGQYLTFLAAAGASLPFPISLAPNAPLWLNPSSLVVLKVPFNLELPITLELPPATASLLLPLQVACVKLATFELFASPLFELAALPPPAKHADQMRPLGSKAGGGTNVSYDPTQNWYRFRWQNGPETLVYVIDMNHPSVALGNLRVSELTSNVDAVLDGGIYYAQGDGQVLLSPLQFQSTGQHILVSASISGNTVTMDWRDEMPTLTGGTALHNRRHEFTLVGRALKVHVRSLDPKGSAADNYYAFGLGNFGYGQAQFVSMKPRPIPYMDQIGITLIDDEWFLSTFIDLFQSNATQHVPALYSTLDQYGHYSELMVYSQLSDGKATPLDETGWVQVSKDVGDLYVESTAPGSPQVHKFQNRIGVTLADNPENATSFSQDKLKIQQLRALGFDDVFLLKQHWMRYGTNRRATSHSPPNPAGGTEQEFKGMLSAALDAGWRAALYTDFYSLDQAQAYDDNPNYSETPGQYENFEDALKHSDDSYRPGFKLAETLGLAGTPYYFTRILAPRRLIKHWEREAQTIQGVYGANAAYFDIACISAPDLIVTAEGANVGGAISLDARSPSDQTIRSTIDSYKSAFGAAGAKVDGPVIGEGSFVGFESRFDTFYWGYLDGFYRSLSTGGAPGAPATSGQNQPVIPDYELQVVRGKLYGIGLGQYTRFFYSGAPGSQYPLQDVAINEYRATEISYGHNGYFLTNSQTTNTSEYISVAQQAKEYYTLRSLQTEWNASTGVTIAYRNAAAGSPWMDLSQAVKADLDLVHPVLREQFDNGLTVIVNHSTLDVVEGGYTLPPNGWTAINPNSGYLNVAVIDPFTGSRMERVLAPNYELADGNGTTTVVGGAIGATLNLSVVRYDTGLYLYEKPSGELETL